MRFGGLTGLIRYSEDKEIKVEEDVHRFGLLIFLHLR